jgi:hypothetical protein
MFKNILPTKRNAGSEGKESNITLFAPAGEGKENNRPGSLPHVSQKGPITASLHTALHPYDEKKRQHTQSAHIPGKKVVESLATDREFEKLLV